MLGGQQTDNLGALRDSPVPQELKALLLTDLSLLELAIDLSHVGNASLTDGFDLALLLLRSTGAFLRAGRVNNE